MILLRRVLRLITGLVCAAFLTGCERQMRDMYDQPKLKPLQPSPLWADGRAARPIEPFTVVHSAGSLAVPSSGRLNAMPIGASKLPSNGHPPGDGDVARGRERYRIFCEPCHGRSGASDGLVVLRGFPAPPCLHINRLRNAPNSHYFDVITHGYGAMYPYSERIPAADRWAIVAFIRALQRSEESSGRAADSACRKRGP